VARVRGRQRLRIERGQGAATPVRRQEEGRKKEGDGERKPGSRWAEPRSGKGA
jgi:hypothetical protein